MSFWKSLFAAGVAAKAYNVLKKPTIVPPPGFTIVDLKHEGIGPNWVVRYVENSRPNSTNVFRIRRGVVGTSIGGKQFRIHWS
jgi:hypothetical protein